MADLKVERGGAEARAAIAESEAMPLRYMAELPGTGTDDEKAIRWLIALVLRSAGDRIDGCGVGRAINYRLKLRSGPGPSKAVVSSAIEGHSS